MISIEQIRAGRALLNWSQNQLAKAAGLTGRALSQLEQGQVEPRAKTLQAIAQALTDAGVELLEGSGVRLVADRLSVQRYEGDGCIDLYLRDIIKELADGSEVLVNGIEEQRLQKAAPTAVEEYFADIKKRKIHERVLVPDTNKLFFDSSTTAYRVLPRNIVGEAPHVIYGNTLAIWVWGPPVQIVLLRSKPVADTFRRNFEVHWDMAAPRKKT